MGENKLESLPQMRVLKTRLKRILLALPFKEPQGFNKILRRIKMSILLETCVPMTHKAEKTNKSNAKKDDAGPGKMQGSNEDVKTTTDANVSLTWDINQGVHLKSATSVENEGSAHVKLAEKIIPFLVGDND